jgi:competence protein ComEC
LTRSWPVWTRGGVALFVSSFVAGAATAPYAAAHFNQVAVYGLIANLLTVPVMGSIVIPGAVLAALLWPLGLSGPVWQVMEWALAWILAVADRVAALPGAVAGVPTPPGWMLGAVTLAALFVLLWQGRARWLGVLPLVAALLSWTSEGRPPVLVSDSGRLVGLGAEGARALSRARGEGFVAEIWLENDGDRVTQEAAAARPGWQPSGEGVEASIAGWTIWHGAGRRALDGAAAACAAHDVVILSEPAPAGPLAAAAADLRARLAAPTPVAVPRGAGCLVIDGPLLAATGALALDPGGEVARITTARMAQGNRAWSP